MEDHIYLKEILQRLAFLGIWKPNMDTTFTFFHRIYSKAMFTYFVTFIATQFIEIYFIQDGQELIENLALTLLFVTTVGKILVSKSNKMKALVKDISSFEKKIFTSTNEIPKEIYMKHALYFHKVIVFVNVVGVTTTFPFFIRPLVEDYLNSQNSLLDTANDVVVEYQRRSLPLSSWFPFDKFKYYWTSYTMQVIVAMYVAPSIVFTNEFFFGIMIFVTGRIRILQQGFRDLKTNAKEYVQKHQQFRENQAASILVANCVTEHKNIIRFVKQLDDSIYFLMFLDFAVCSIQIGITAFWVIVTTQNVQLGVVLIYFTAMLIQLFLFYWFANDVTFESTQISSAIWHSSWYEFSKPLKKSLVLVMLRAQKPLTLSVGPFYVMANGTALMILKTAYSFVAVLSKVYTNEK